MDEQDGMTERQSVAEAAGAEVTVAAEEDTAEKAGAVSEGTGAAEEGVVAKTAVVAEVTAESEERASGGAEEVDGMGTAASEESANPAKEAGTWEAEWQRKVSAYAAKAVYSEARAVAAMLAGVLAGCAAAHEFEGYTNMLDQRAGVTWTRTAAVEALLAADTGLIDRWGGELVRDNYEFYVLREAGQNRGVRIEYGKNLLGVECTTDVTDVIARVMPVGKTYKDKDLFLVPGTYTVNGTTVTIGAGETWVTSEQASDYPAPMMSVLDTDIKAKSKDADDVLAARLKMIEAALNKFADDKCDQPSVNVKVTFVNLGDTVEYEQYKRLEDVFLCDRVTVRHPGIGVDVLTEVIEVVWDCLTGRAKSIELGRVQLDRARIKVPVWQLPSGIPGTLVASGTLSAGAAKDDFGASLDLSANTTATTMYVVVESSAGSVLKGQATTIGTTLVARVYRGGVEITGDLDASLFSWSRVSADTTADATWAAAHAGVKSVAVTAAEFASAPAIYHCDVADATEEA